MSNNEDTKLPAYFVEKPQKGGHILHYWQPSAALKRAGFTTVALGKNRAEAIQKAAALNVKVDKWKGGQPVRKSDQHGTIPWIIAQFKQSPAWAKLKKSTMGTYEGHFRFILRWSASKGDPPMRTIKKLDAQKLWASLAGPHLDPKNHKPARAQEIVRRCSQLWNYALDLSEDDEIVVRNPWKMDLEELKPREQVWQPAQIAALIETALTPGPWGSKSGPRRTDAPRPSMALATILAHNTAQRPSDLMALRWSQYYQAENGHWYIQLTQIKTGAKVTIPVTEELKIALDGEFEARKSASVVALSPRDQHILINELTGGPWKLGAFDRAFRKICQGAGVPDDMQFRDIRRTAATALAEAGCTLHEIAAIGGWSIDTVAQMMKTYARANVTMANNAVLKLEQYRRSLER